MERVTLSQRNKHTAKVFCDHCQGFVGRSTYYRHRSKFYDQRRKPWTFPTEEITDSSSDSESVIVPDTQESVTVDSEEPQGHCE